MGWGGPGWSKSENNEMAHNVPSQKCYALSEIHIGFYRELYAYIENQQFALQLFFLGAWKNWTIMKLA